MGESAIARCGWWLIPRSCTAATRSRGHYGRYPVGSVGRFAIESGCGVVGKSDQLAAAWGEAAAAGAKLDILRSSVGSAARAFPWRFAMSRLRVPNSPLLSVLTSSTLCGRLERRWRPVSEIPRRPPTHLRRNHAPLPRSGRSSVKEINREYLPKSTSCTLCLRLCFTGPESRWEGLCEEGALPGCPRACGIAIHAWKPVRSVQVDTVFVVGSGRRCCCPQVANRPVPPSDPEFFRAQDWDAAV